MKGKKSTKERVEMKNGGYEKKRELRKEAILKKKRAEEKSKENTSDEGIKRNRKD